MLRGRNDLELDVADEQVVERLLADQAHEISPGSGGLSVGDVPAGEVATAGVEELAGLHRDLDRLPDLLPRRVPIDVVELVEIDVVGLQPAQTCIERSADVERRQLAFVGPAPHLAIDLGGDDGPLPPAAAAGEPVADDGFRLARLAAVAVGGVEEVDPLLMGDVHDGVRVLLGGSGSKVHRAETKSGDTKAGTAEIGEVH